MYKRSLNRSSRDGSDRTGRWVCCCLKQHGYSRFTARKRHAERGDTTLYGHIASAFFVGNAAKDPDDYVVLRAIVVWGCHFGGKQTRKYVRFTLLADIRRYGSVEPQLEPAVRLMSLFMSRKQAVRMFEDIKCEPDLFLACRCYDPLGYVTRRLREI